MVLVATEKASGSLREGWELPRPFRPLHSTHRGFQPLPAVLTLRNFKIVNRVPPALLALRYDVLTSRNILAMLGRG